MLLKGSPKISYLYIKSHAIRIAQENHKYFLSKPFNKTLKFVKIVKIAKTCFKVALLSHENSHHASLPSLLCMSARYHLLICAIEQEAEFNILPKIGL